MEKRQFPVGVIQICCIAPEPLISAMVKVSPGFITMNGLTFQPCPSSRAASFALPFSKVAIPPLPGSPVKFSGPIDRVFASDRRDRLPRFMSRPLNELFFCAVTKKEEMHKSKQAIENFISAVLLERKFTETFSNPATVF